MTGRYIDPFSDFGFKKIFGEEPNKQLLIDFLQQVLQDKEPDITNITYLPKEELGDQEEDRSSYFDLLCETDNGKVILVEMQRGHQTHFLERLLYYASKLINRQGKKGKHWNYELNKVYVISLADFPIAEYQGCPDFVQDLILQNPKYPNLPFDFLTIRTLETEKFTKTKEELETKYDQWMFYLTQMAGWEEEPNKLPEDRAIRRLLEVASILNLEKAEYEQYQAEIDRRNDEYSRLVSAGEKGEARGEAKGRDERTIEIAKAMLADGVDMKIVSKYSSLSLEELAKL